MEHKDNAAQEESGFARESKMEDPDAVPVSEWYNPAESEFAQESKMREEIIEHKDNAAQLSPLLKAIDLILADPAEITRESLGIYQRFREKHEGNFTDDAIDDAIADMTADKIISKYAYFAGFAGGATALTGVVPGLGTAVAMLGGAMADTALSMKFQIEMTMAIAVVYGYDITIEEQKRLCFLIAGLGAINHAAKDSSKVIGAKAFTLLVHDHLRGATLAAMKQVFRKIGIIFTRNAIEKAIPFGVGVVVGVSMGQVLTRYVGYKAKDFFKIHREGTAPMLGKQETIAPGEEQTRRRAIPERVKRFFKR